MGLLARLKGTEQPPEVQPAVAQLEAELPEGWRFVEFRWQLFCRRPVKLSACGATAEGPGKKRALAVSTDEGLGVPAVRGLLDAVQGRAVTSRTWAPPPIRQRETGRYTGELLEPESDEEAAARREALELLPAGATPMNVDVERFGGVRVHAVVIQLADGSGLAGAGLTAAEAWSALAQRLDGRLAASPVWFPALES